MATQPELTARTFAFLFTDLEGSTRLWEQHPQAMRTALDRHDALLRQAVESSNGRVLKTTGDGLSAVFTSALDGLSAALKAQRGLLTETWGETGPLRVRMGLHVGEAQPRDGDYYGTAVNRAARLMAIAHGGQVLLSMAAASLTRDQLPLGSGLRDLGEHRLKDLERPEHVFQLLHPDLIADFPPLAALVRPSNLPVQATSLIGREAELEDIVARLTGDDLRLLTLTGPGGIGKTSLAVRAAAESSAAFADGTFFVDLAPVRDPQGLPTAISHVIGVRESRDRPLMDELKDRLRPRSVLLLLDNFEQVTAAATAVAELLSGCPRLKVLVTSREALRLRGEVVFSVRPLALPTGDPRKLSIEELGSYEALRLFVERAQAANPAFKATTENTPAIAEICLRLDGLPLAIELAAARTHLFTPQALLDRLGRRLALGGGARDLPARQRTLRYAIKWSYELLDGGEQRLFNLLAVFTGGCSIEAVEALARDVGQSDDEDVEALERLSSLVEKSLLRQVELENGAPRLVMLETIREFAAERLEEDPAFLARTRRAHAAYFAEVARSQWERVTADGREAALVGLDVEIENVRAAWAYWAAERDLEQLGKLVDSLWLYYDARGRYRGTIDLTQELLVVLSATPSTPERAQEEIVLQTSLARAILAVEGYTPAVEEAYTRALERSRSVGDKAHLPPILRGLANIYSMRGEFEKGSRMGEQILALANELDDGGMRVEGHLVLGENIGFMRDFQVGLDHLEKGISSFDARRSPTRFQLANNPGVACYTTSALFLWMLGFPERAVARADQSIALAKNLDHPYSIAYAMFHDSLLHLYMRDPESARARARAVIELAEEHAMKLWSAAATCLEGAALVGTGIALEGLAQIQRGMDLYQGLRSPPIFWPLLLRIQAAAYARAGDPRRGLDRLDQALEITKDWSGAALAPEFLLLKGQLLLAVSPENAGEAETCYRQALAISIGIKGLTSQLAAAASLHRLRRDAESRALLNETYSRFTEGFDTADLIEARELLAAAT